MNDMKDAIESICSRVVNGRQELVDGNFKITKLKKNKEKKYESKESLLDPWEVIK